MFNDIQYLLNIKNVKVSVFEATSSFVYVSLSFIVKMVLFLSLRLQF